MEAAGFAGGLDIEDIVDTVDTADTVDAVHTVDIVHTVHTLDIAHSVHRVHNATWYLVLQRGGVFLWQETTRRFLLNCRSGGVAVFN